MALALYFEAATESDLGRLAIASVIKNRVESVHFPNNICDVVEQGPTYTNGAPKRHQCEFSFWCDGKSDYPKDIELFEHCLDIAEYVLEPKYTEDPTKGALFYHATYIDRPWSYKYLLTIENHVFYTLRE